MSCCTCLREETRCARTTYKNQFLNTIIEDGEKKRNRKYHKQAMQKHCLKSFFECEEKDELWIFTRMQHFARRKALMLPSKHFNGVYRCLVYRCFSCVFRHLTCVFRHLNGVFQHLNGVFRRLNGVFRRLNGAYQCLNNTGTSMMYSGVSRGYTGASTVRIGAYTVYSGATTVYPDVSIVCTTVPQRRIPMLSRYWHINSVFCASGA